MRLEVEVMFLALKSILKTDSNSILTLLLL